MNVLNANIEKLLKAFLNLEETDWIQWTAQPNDWLDDCDKFDGCYFIVKNMPQYPQHPRCQCIISNIAQPIPNETAFASCDIREFTDYIFSVNNNNGKMAIFENIGYNKQDSARLQEIYLLQALEKYCNGDYKYKGVNNYCVKIEINIELLNSSGKLVCIKTGWQLKPYGQISLSTPFSGWAK